MKINQEIIRNLVLNEISLIVISKKKPLSFYLFEDVEDNIKIAANIGPAAVRDLVNSYDDKHELKKALHGMHDENKYDDKIHVSSTMKVRVGELVPTQNEVDLMKSIAFPLGHIDILKKVIMSNTSDAPGSLSIAGNEILDGHHRWSGVWGICGPSGEISVENIDLPGENTAQKLAAAQLAIAAYKDPEQKQPAASEEIIYNILGKSKDAVFQMILDNVGKKTSRKVSGTLLNDEMLVACVNDDVVAEWADFDLGTDTDTVKFKIISRVANNLAGDYPIPSNPDAPERIDMPQFDAASIGGKQAKKDIYAGLSAGDFNIKEPFRKDNVQIESNKQTNNILVERWQRLAGIK